MSILINLFKKMLIMNLMQGLLRILKIEVKGNNSSFNSITSREIPKGFSMIEQLEATIAVGTTLGWNMVGCEKKTQESITAENGEFFGHQ